VGNGVLGGLIDIFSRIFPLTTSFPARYTAFYVSFIVVLPGGLVFARADCTDMQLCQHCFMQLVLVPLDVFQLGKGLAALITGVPIVRDKMPATTPISSHIMKRVALGCLPELGSALENFWADWALKTDETRLQRLGYLFC